MATLKKNLALHWLLIFLVGGLGGILLDRLVLPYLSTLSWFRHWPILSSATPLIINRREEIHIDEGINRAEVLNRLRGSLVRVLVHDGEFGLPRTRLLQVLAGVVVTSDGVLAVPTGGALRPEQVLTVVFADQEVATARMEAFDSRTGLSLLRVSRQNLAVAKPGASVKLREGERLLVVTGEGEDLRQLALFPAAATGPAVRASGLLRTYELGQFAASVPVAGETGEAAPGAVAVDKDGLLLGLLTQVGREKFFLRAEDLQLVVKNFLDDGKIVWPALKISYQILDTVQAKFLGLPGQYGILIKAAPGPLRENDFLLAVNGRDLSAEEDLQQRLFGLRPGEQVSLRLLRGGVEQEVKITLP